MNRDDLREQVEMARMFVAGTESGMPVLFTREYFTILSDYRKCRHAVRNCYGHELVWNKLRPMMERSPDVLQRFKDSVMQALDDLSPVN